MNTRAVAWRAVFALLVGASGVVLLALFAEPAGRRLACLPFAVVGVMATACALPYALGLAIAPAPWALKARHLAAGAMAAWLAYALAGAARLLGLGDTSDVFRVLWAPVVEELCKAAMLAAVWTYADDRRDRRELVTAAVGVGIGFAMRENIVYFGAALGHPTSTTWIVLRAVPPVLAHASFGMILGGTVAQGAIHARVVGARARRVSVLGAVVAIIAHGVYNGVALLFARMRDDRALVLTAGWSLVAVAIAVVLRGRAIETASQDEPCVTSIAPPVGTVAPTMFALYALLVACWLVPGVAARYVAVVFTPLALGAAVAWPVARAARAARIFTPLIVGVAIRPLVRTLEVLVEVLARALRLRGAANPLEAVSNALWLGVVAALVVAIARTRGRLGAVAIGTGLAAGMVGASLGGMLATQTSVGLVHALLEATARLLPRTLGLGALVARLAWRSNARALGATAGVALVATAFDRLARRLPARATTDAFVALVGLLLVAGVVYEALRRTRREATVAARIAPAS